MEDTSHTHTKRRIKLDARTQGRKAGREAWGGVETCGSEGKHSTLHGEDVAVQVYYEAPVPDSKYS